MWNIGSLHYAAIGEATTLFGSFFYGLGVMLPKIVVSYAVGLGIEIAVAQWKKEEVHEGFFVTGILIPMIVPETPTFENSPDAIAVFGACQLCGLHKPALDGSAE